MTIQMSLTLAYIQLPSVLSVVTMHGETDPPPGCSAIDYVGEVLGNFCWTWLFIVIYRPADCIERRVAFVD